MTSTDRIEAIKRLAPGKCVSTRRETIFAQVGAKKAGRYKVTCGWTVMPGQGECTAFEDSGQICKYFSNIGYFPWVGRAQYADTAEEAAQIYDRYLELLTRHETEQILALGGEVAGNRA